MGKLITMILELLFGKKLNKVEKEKIVNEEAEIVAETHKEASDRLSKEADIKLHLAIRLEKLKARKERKEERAKHRRDLGFLNVFKKKKNGK